MKRVGRWLGYLVAAALLAVFGLVVLVPAVTGATTLTVLTGSMEPTIKPGALVAVKPVDAADLKIGDVVTFRPESDSDILITHRIVAQSVGQDGTEFITQGDANNAQDEPIVAEQIRGKVTYAIPGLGWVRQGLQSAGPALYVAVGAVMLVALLWPLFTRSRQRGDQQNASNESSPAPSAGGVDPAGRAEANTGEHTLATAGASPATNLRGAS